MTKGPITDYWEFDDGLVIMRRTTTDKGACFRLMRERPNDSTWPDYCAWRDLVDVDHREFDAVEAAKIAAQLGGSLEEDDKVPMEEKGRFLPVTATLRNGLWDDIDAPFARSKSAPLGVAQLERFAARSSPSG